MKSSVATVLGDDFIMDAQHRCMRRIREMQESGMTILLVSHDPHAIRALCSSAMLLHGGQVEALGKPADVLFELLSDGDTDHGAPVYEFVDAIDLDADGRPELLVIYHDYEFHEFQVLRLGAGQHRYDIVHRGPTYGC